jgi:hypothetical protein
MTKFISDYLKVYMKKTLTILFTSVSLIFSGCLEIEQGLILNNDGSGKMELKTDMGQVMAMMSMMGKEEEKIKKDTVITYKANIDTAKSLTDAEKALLNKASWRLRMNSDDGIFDLTLGSDFKELNDVKQLLELLARWDNIDILGNALKDLAPPGTDAGMDDMGMGKGKKSIGDMTKDYFKTTWQNGKLHKTLDAEAYKKINEDESLNSFKKLGELAQGGEDILEKINITTKFILPRPAKKTEGKNVKVSEDKKTITISAPVSDIYTAPKNYEYDIEY